MLRLGGGLRGFQGLIGEVLVFDRELSDSEAGNLSGSFWEPVVGSAPRGYAGTKSWPVNVPVRSTHRRDRLRKWGWPESLRMRKWVGSVASASF